MVVLAEERGYDRAAGFEKGVAGKAWMLEEDEHAVEAGVEQIVYKKIWRKNLHLFFVEV